MDLIAVEESAPPRKKMKIVEDDETLIPDELILQSILPFLPIKSAIRFQAVSKPWRNFIKHPFFTRLHLSVSQSRNPTTFLVLSTTAGELSRCGLNLNNLPSYTTSMTMIEVVSIAVDRKDKTIEPGRVQYAPLQAGKEGLFWKRRNFGGSGRVVGVCYGVFCAAYASFAILWNPAIREVKYVVFRLSDFGISGLNIRDRVSCVGFGAVKDGYGNVVNFKLLAMVRNSLDDPGCFSVYSLNTDKWTMVQLPSFMVDRIEERAGCVFLNGVLYWLAWGSVAKDSAFVLTFDIMCETLERIELPRFHGNEPIVMKKSDHYFLTVFDGRYLLLSVVSQEFQGTHVDFWALIDDGNKKRWMKVENLMGPIQTRGQRILGYWAGGNAVIASNGRKLDFHTNDKCTTYEIGFSRSMMFLEYVETFVSPKRISEQDDFQDIDSTGRKD